MSTLLFNDKEGWDPPLLEKILDACGDVALREMELDVYPNQIEIISAEQMLDAYASTGMPIFYHHWSFGKHFAQHEGLYQTGKMGLAYEIVINSNPCISYCMEGNTATMQTLVIAHAAFGHNHFFKNNYAFRERTDASAILNYLEYAKKFVARCEKKYGVVRVERILDAAHALRAHGVDTGKRLRVRSFAQEEKRFAERRERSERDYNDLMSRTTPAKKEAQLRAQDLVKKSLPEENILRVVERHAPRLEVWERELVRIVRLVAEYFHPQRETKLMNEGCATKVHYDILTRLHETGRISNGSFLEFLASHTSVTFQPSFDHPEYSGINPYALGFAMMQDIGRIAKAPTAEDREWFPAYAGCGDHLGVLKDAWHNYRDESFILQFLSPRLMREFRLFSLKSGANEPTFRVEHIHDEAGYRSIRRDLAKRYDPSLGVPNIQIVDVDLLGDRTLVLAHTSPSGAHLEKRSKKEVLKYLSDLWRYPVVLHEQNAYGVTIDTTESTYDDSPTG